MLNVNTPIFPVAILAMLIGVRLALLVYQRWMCAPAPAEGPSPAPLAPDDGETETIHLAPATADDDHPVSRLRVVFELIDSAIVAVVLVFFLIRPFLVQAFFIPSGSMIPTLQQGDKLLALKYTYHLREPWHGEVVVFRAPKIALECLGERENPEDPKDYVKRVVGVPHDRIRIIAGDGIYRNGVRVVDNKAIPDYDFPINRLGELTIRDATVRAQLLPHIHGQELVVPAGYLFVLGDNRTQSHDGHIWGLLPRDRLIGKALFIFWPSSRVGLIH